MFPHFGDFTNGTFWMAFVLIYDPVQFTGNPHFCKSLFTILSNSAYNNYNQNTTIQNCYAQDFL